ncbi:hypothetical protein BGZ51_005214 [Haplosporangium sp. Z 767]|nr:hypothetical protein BGZ50_008515 [Haplosporangium sp. Z 11]KAF9192624.1 hypothetical protein BGZ51_005214 [Haplosporangium sp. Z 767]
MGGTTLVLEATPEHIAYALMGCFIIVFGLVSLFVKEKLFISEAFVATAFGIIIGPYAIGIFDPAGWHEFDKVTLEFTRIVIAIQVMAAGVSLPRSYVFKEKASLFIILVPLMVLMWATSALLIWGVIPDLSFIESMVIAACVTPTDPVLSNSVVKGRFAEKHVPPRIRYLLSAESGVNDGMGLPFLFLGLYLMRETTTGMAIAKWFYLVWAYQILLSIIIGGVIGYACRKLLKGAKNRNLIDKESFLVFSIALALAVAGIVSILASDDLLACFVAGNIFAWDDWFSNEIAEAHIQEIIDMLLNLACFVFIGASIPFSSFGDALISLSVWRLVVLAIAILFLRRLPYMLIMKPLIPALSSYREAAFAGWFGPIGVGAVFFTKVTAVNLSPEHLGENPYNGDRLNRVRDVIFPVVMFLVLSSVLIHGITVPLLHLQYKYTRTWSKKREDSNHAVTRLPHINIGDEIVLRPPTISGASVSGARDNDAEQKPGYDHQRSIGYDNQRSIGYDHQRSINQRSYGYGGFGIAGVPDFSRSNNNTVRTLQDVVKEMKDASRGTANNRSLRPQAANNMTNNGSNSPPVNPRDNANTNLNVFAKDGGQSVSQSNSEQPTNKESADAEKIAESLARNHPASHAIGPHVSITPSDSPDDSRSPQSDTSTTKLNHPQIPAVTVQQPASVIHTHEDEEEDYNGVVRRVSRDSYEETRVEETKCPQLPKDSSSSGHHHLTDLFKRYGKETA